MRTNAGQALASSSRHVRAIFLSDSRIHDRTGPCVASVTRAAPGDTVRKRGGVKKDASNVTAVRSRGVDTRSIAWEMKLMRRYLERQPSGPPARYSAEKIARVRQ